MSPIGRLRVTRTYAPDRNGAKRFARRYGDQLVCVRHRLGDDGQLRYTTVELVVESTPVVARPRTTIALRIPPKDQETRRLLMACGARWHPEARHWQVQLVVARNLGLLKYRVRVPLHG